MPTVPPQFLSFVHPAGEAHITTVSASTGNATMVQCPGQENEACRIIYLSCPSLLTL